MDLGTQGICTNCGRSCGNWNEKRIADGVGTGGAVARGASEIGESEGCEGGRGVWVAGAEVVVSERAMVLLRARRTVWRANASLLSLDENVLITSGEWGVNPRDQVLLIAVGV